MGSLGISAVPMWDGNLWGVTFGDEFNLTFNNCDDNNDDDDHYDYVWLNYWHTNEKLTNKIAYLWRESILHIFLLLEIY